MRNLLEMFIKAKDNLRVFVGTQVRFNVINDFKKL